ncbi:hypothetical protein [Polyangium sp. y55x31]|uniref:monooxygenase n=1 Tax=Polyangium sp. y55x31 TaxID=3042688 RepID=UPI002482C0AF|nr:hypothetical protein [Polyangium sp. y55x31]MDI1479363.1 hypothetical protein [Polyangium sp. y55x31]
MMTRRLEFQLVVGSLVLASAGLVGCGADVVVQENPPVSTSGTSTEEWKTLIDTKWEIGGGIESYWCATKTFHEDLYISAFRPLGSTGTHHTLLLWAPGTQPDSETVCGPTIHESMVFASGIGTDDLVFPEGVALKIPAGTQLLLNLHLFNTTTEPLPGISGTLVKTLDPSEVKQEAEMIMPGAPGISVPPNSPGSVQGDCTFPADATLVSVWPHMHNYGTHMRVTHQTNAGDVTLHDAPFSFTEQKNYPLTPATVLAGDRIHYECSYMNTTAKTLGFGTSSDDEMCFVGLYRYPKLASACQN